ncbi:hypothetical protein [uncultured Brachybacterium sp.]|uniref:hypothetical protein n=1 Tax=uncultured Brachybacterium sp. TaxID=189680 RepID=UPI00261234C9|nr:hypothetical protein [uncultured Brachybacterium sp.]
MTWSNHDLAELAPNIYGPLALRLGVANWRGIDLALEVVATPEGYRCPSVTLSRRDGVIDYAAFRLTPIEEVLRATAQALVMVAPDGGTFWWPIDGQMLDDLRKRAAADKATRDGLVVMVHALASFAGLPPRDTVVRALEIPTATVTRIIARARNGGTYPEPFPKPRPIRNPPAEVGEALAEHFGAPADHPHVGEAVIEQEA